MPTCNGEAKTHIINIKNKCPDMRGDVCKGDTVEFRNKDDSTRIVCSLGAVSETTFLILAPKGSSGETGQIVIKQSAVVGVTHKYEVWEFDADGAISAACVGLAPPEMIVGG